MPPYHTIDLSIIEAHNDKLGSVLIVKPLNLKIAADSDSEAVIITMSIPLCIKSQSLASNAFLSTLYSFGEEIIIERFALFKSEMNV